MNWEILSFIIGFVITIFFWIRVKTVLRVRNKFIGNIRIDISYFFALPSSSSMVFSPKHWSKWTFKSWYAYADDKIFENSGRV